jgi:DNA repair exonuclease SbcCD ATPase subunit
MADENGQELKIHIVSDADNSGFKSAATASNELGAENSKTASTTDELSKKQEEGAEHANILHKNHRLVHDILHLIAHESGPAAGAAFAAIGAAAGGGLMLAVFAVKELLNWFHELHEKAKEFRELMESQIDLTPMVKEIGEVATATETAKQKTKEFFEELERKSKETDGWKKIADAQIEQLKRVADEQKKVADADADRDKAKLEYLKATKQITAEQYAQGMAAVEAMKQNKKDDADAGLSEKSIAVLVNALNNIDLQKHLTAPQVQGANQKAEEAKKAVESLKATIETNRKLMEAHLEKITGGKDGKGLQGALGDVTGFMDNLFGESKVMEVAGMSDEDRKKEWEADQNRSFTKHSPDFWDKVKRAREIMDKIGEERSAEAGNAGTIRSLRAKLPGAESTASTSENDVKALEQKLNQLEADQKAIKEELEKRQGEDSARAGAAGDIAGAKTVEGAFKSATVPTPGGANHHLTAFAQAQHQLEENQKVGRELATAAQQAAREHNSSLGSILKSLQEIRAQNISLQQQINSMPHTVK